MWPSNSIGHHGTTGLRANHQWEVRTWPTAELPGRSRAAKAATRADLPDPAGPTTAVTLLHTKTQRVLQSSGALLTVKLEDKPLHAIQAQPLQSRRIIWSKQASLTSSHEAPAHEQERRLL